MQRDGPQINLYRHLLGLRATIVTDEAVLDTSLRIVLRAGTTAVVRETVVLGRLGRAGGGTAGTSPSPFDEGSRLHHTTVLDGADWSCAARRTAGARAVGTLLVAGSARGRPVWESGRVSDWAWSALADPGVMLLAVSEPCTVTTLLDLATAGGALVEAQVAGRRLQAPSRLFAEINSGGRRIAAATRTLTSGSSLTENDHLPLVTVP